MEYDIIDDKIHIYKNAARTTTYVYWPEELIKIVEAQEAGLRSIVLPDFAEILAEVLDERPECFTCHYNSDLIM
ncbi:hypothetical protein ACXWTF_02570 [Thiomicrolovo sp. ZZH C-3]